MFCLVTKHEEWSTLSSDQYTLKEPLIDMKHFFSLPKFSTFLRTNIIMHIARN